MLLGYKCQFSRFLPKHEHLKDLFYNHPWKDRLAATDFGLLFYEVAETTIAMRRKSRLQSWISQILYGND
jgi:hypothetical protein